MRWQLRQANDPDRAGHGIPPVRPQDASRTRLLPTRTWWPSDRGWEKAIRDTLARYRLKGPPVVELPRPTKGSRGVIAVTGSMIANEAAASRRIGHVLSAYLLERTAWLVGSVGHGRSDVRPFSTGSPSGRHGRRLPSVRLCGGAAPGDRGRAVEIPGCLGRGHPSEGWRARPSATSCSARNPTWSSCSGMAKSPDDEKLIHYFQDQGSQYPGGVCLIGEVSRMARSPRSGGGPPPSGGAVEVSWRRSLTSLLGLGLAFLAFAPVPGEETRKPIRSSRVPPGGGPPGPPGSTSKRGRVGVGVANA